MKILLSAVLAVFLLLAGIWLVVIGEDQLAGQIRKAFAGGNLSAEITGLEKGLFFDFGIRALEIRKSGKPILLISDLSGRFDPFSLPLLKLPVSLKGRLGGGTIEGTVELLKGHVFMTVDHARMEEVHLFSLAGLKGGGTVSGELKGKREESRIRLSIRDMRLDRGAFLGLDIPLDMFYSARGVMTLRGDSLNVESLFLEGKDISARIKGNIVSGRMDLTLELMKGAAFADTSGILPFIEGYRVAPGYYVIPVKGDMVIPG